MSKFNLKLYACVYHAIIGSPESNFMYDTITTAIFFRNLQCLIKVKIQSFAHYWEIFRLHT